MKIIRKVIPIILCVMMIVSLCSCSFLPFGGGNKDDTTAEAAEAKIDTNFSASTNVSYSAGNDSNWSYGNQRKEFPQNETCYVRVGSTVIAEKHRNIGEAVTVTYTFTGAQNCNIELSDGIATRTDSSDPNVVTFTRTISAEKEKKAAESIVIFQYIPNSSATSITLEVTYDDHVPAQYDARNTIYFSK